MAFVVFVASDIFGQKVNLEIEFPTLPGLGDLSQYIEAAFTAEQNVRRPGSHPYQVSKLQVVDENTDDWVDVVSPTQLRKYCQVYSFQPHSTRYTEAQGHIPAAVKPRMQGAPPPVGAAYGMMPPPASVQRGYAVPAVPGHEPAPAMPQSKLLPDQATHDQKVRISFEEVESIDGRGAPDGRLRQAIQPDQLKRAFDLCELDFSAQTQEDLFRKADCDKDGVVSFSEWQRWAELYPSTLDCLYFRFKLRYERLAAEAKVDAVRNLRPRLEDNEREAQRAQDQQARDESECQQRADAAARAVEDAMRGLEAADRDAKGQQGVADAAKGELADRQRDLAAQREAERQAKIQAQNAARDLDAAQRRQRAAQQAAAAAEKAAERHRQALQEAEKERERQLELAAQADGEVAAAKDRHDSIMGTIPEQIQEAQRRVQDAERGLQDAEGRLRDLARAVQSAQRAADEGRRRKDDDERQLSQVRAAKDPTRRAVDDARMALEDHDAKVQKMQEDVDRDAERAKELWPKENSLCEQEVRLREQRESLEQKEGALREAHTSFFQQAGRLPSPQRQRAGYEYSSASPTGARYPPANW
eukprot:TRINITY_DN2410_c0_g6_i1.p1 TRINITY_DN2410_c0_g6~~TRINITY_DN2410_c0_g6_i1.p1  ORF type:complete len:587 (+),score=232.56 TRINITY_DN2410_c0_g6_i1:79-1839(+)